MMEMTTNLRMILGGTALAILLSASFSSSLQAAAAAVAEDPAEALQGRRAAAKEITLPRAKKALTKLKAQADALRAQSDEKKRARVFFGARLANVPDAQARSQADVVVRRPAPVLDIAAMQDLDRVLALAFAYKTQILPKFQATVEASEAKLEKLQRQFQALNEPNGHKSVPPTPQKSAKPDDLRIDVAAAGGQVDVSPTPQTPQKDSAPNGLKSEGEAAAAASSGGAPSSPFKTPKFQGKWAAAEKEAADKRVKVEKTKTEEIAKAQATLDAANAKADKLLAEDKQRTEGKKKYSGDANKEAREAKIRFQEDVRSGEKAKAQAKFDADKRAAEHKAFVALGEIETKLAKERASLTAEDKKVQAEDARRLLRSSSKVGFLSVPSTPLAGAQGASAAGSPAHAAPSAPATPVQSDAKPAAAAGSPSPVAIPSAPATPAKADAKPAAAAGSPSPVAAPSAPATPAKSDAKPAAAAGSPSPVAIPSVPATPVQSGAKPAAAAGSPSPVAIPSAPVTPAKVDAKPAAAAAVPGGVPAPAPAKPAQLAAQPVVVPGSSPVLVIQG